MAVVVAVGVGVRRGSRRPWFMERAAADGARCLVVCVSGEGLWSCVSVGVVERECGLVRLVRLVRRAVS